MKAEEWDDRRVYCPALGMVVEFRYCRACGKGAATDGKSPRRLPCARLMGCWAERVDVVAFLEEHYSKEEVSQWVQPGQTRLERLYAAVSHPPTAE